MTAKPEIRNPKPERNSKPQGRSPASTRSYTSGPTIADSDFSLRSAFGPRPSDFARHAFTLHSNRAASCLCLTLLVFGLATGLLAQQLAAEEGRSRFCAVDIYVDAGSTPLAAYQLEFAATNGVAKIVGIEGGEHPAFRQPPFYDPGAIQHERVILASFSTAAATDLPTGKTRIATIHYQTTETLPPQFELKLQAAADAQGANISAQASFIERKTP